MTAASQLISSQLPVLPVLTKSIIALSFRTDPGDHGVQPDKGSPVEMVIGDDEMDSAGSLTEVAVKVTVELLGAVLGAW